MAKSLKNLFFAAKTCYFLAVFAFLSSIFETFFAYFYHQNLSLSILIGLTTFNSSAILALIFGPFIPKLAPIYWKNSYFTDKLFRKDVCDLFAQKGKIYTAFFGFFFLILFVIGLYYLIAKAIVVLSLAQSIACFLTFLTSKLHVDLVCLKKIRQILTK
ncbi:hypothetical protein [Mycoplasma sp. 'Moose RK']|uniref:hypothetical protein n=1 Tax=Mycoplasma sp. 'Moose RK' TaxID=2780095 RepID=UPI0018C347C9|nr:hypothetical protein [Mycoplasma sp. 'Moose RK']MBG0730771.1 hypothetical protein [Mycoplasma sp. 'Moose RK']